MAVLAHLQERVLSTGHAVHVEETDQRTTDHLAEEGDVFLDVGRHDGDVMHAGGRKCWR
jgi:hypothetical protein